MDFSQIENMAGKFGFSEEMIQKMKDNLSDKINSGEIDEKQAKNLEKKCAKSAKAFDKITEKLSKKGIEMPDFSSLASMIPADFDPSSIDMSNLPDIDPSMLQGMGLDGMSPDDIQNMAGDLFGSNDENEE